MIKWVSPFDVLKREERNKSALCCFEMFLTLFRIKGVEEIKFSEKNKNARGKKATATNPTSRQIETLTLFACENLLAYSSPYLELFVCKK